MKFFVLGTAATLAAAAAAWQLPSSFTVDSPTTRRGFSSSSSSSRQQQPLFSGTSSAGRDLHLHTSSCHRWSSLGGKRRFAARSSDDDDDKEQQPQQQPGMEKAFRELEALQSLDDDHDDNNNNNNHPSAKGFDAITTATSLVDVITTTQASEVTPEKEVQIYQDMVKELENKNEDDLYSDVLADMGGTTAATATAAAAAARSASIKSNPPSILGKEDVSQRDREDFMNQALEEALQDVQLNNPSISKSILDDQEMMKEIETIFERGNEKLLASLEEIRTEQRELAKVSATQNAQSAMDSMQEDAARLSLAEASLEAMLNKVNQETESVQRAVRDLEAAQANMDRSSDFFIQLKKGGIVKQSALVGMLLFAMRSILDTVSSLSDASSSPGLFTAALIQGGIALACAAVFFLIK